METLVVAQHKNQYFDRTKDKTPVRFRSFGFKEINCRGFESGAGILPTPLRSSSLYSKTPSPSSIQVKSNTDDQKKSKKSAPSSAISIPINVKGGADYRKGEFLNDEFAYSELWAGPAYSNSPPPSSLPMPKFSLRAKRTVSLDLPTSPASDIDLPPLAKSAPASPTRDRSLSPGVSFGSTDSATQTLRRILNLENID